MIMIRPCSSDLLGLILVGGESRRMGKAKAYLDYGRGPQYQNCQTILQEFCDDVYFSVSLKLSPPLPVPATQKIDDVFLEPIGPLAGIISAFKRFPHNAFFVLACDLPYFDASKVSKLLSLRNPNKKATIYFVDDKAEPLCGIYEPAICADLIMSWFEKKYCLRKIVANLPIEQVSLHDQDAFVNVNHDYEFKKFADENLVKIVDVLYYASLRHETGIFKERIKTNAATLMDLFWEIKRKYSLSIEPHLLRFAKNDQLVLPKEPLFDEDVVVFLPPVGGG